jgi:hypothetical protein
MLALKPTDLGPRKLKDDYDVLDESRKTIGRKLWTRREPRGDLVLDHYRARTAATT